jgi:hypothetical protein
MLILIATALLAAQDWTTLHSDNARSGWVPQAVAGPYERKWYRDFHDEMIASRVEAIVAEKKVFVPTFAGNLHALDVADGRTVWTFKANGPIGHSPLYLDGALYVGADDGHVYAVKAADGTLLWRSPVGAGVWVHPAGHGDRIYVGDRAGVFHALDAKTGTARWVHRTGGMILKPASVSEDGARVVFGSEDMHVYCLSRDGKLLWTSAKLQGVTTRDNPPTLWKGLAIVRTAPADGFHEVMNRNQNLLARVQRSIPLGPADKVLDDKHGAYILRFNPDRVKPEQDAVVKYLQENRHDQTFYALSMEDGKEPWTAPIFYTCGLHNPPTAPAFDPATGELYTYARSSITNWSRGVRPFTTLGKLDRATGRWEPLLHAKGDDAGWSDFASIGDETQALSGMGGILLSTHQGTIGGLRLKDRLFHGIVNARDSYAGIYGPGLIPGSWEGEKKMQREGWLVNMPNEWHGPDKSILAVAEKRLFWLAGSQVVCIAGPDVPRAESGGAKPPPPVKKRFERVVAGGGNVTADRVGGFDASVERKALPAGALDAVWRDAPARGSDPALDAAVLEVVEGGPWAPFVVQLGISREELHFWRAGEALQIVALALPHLSDGPRAKAKAWLDALYEAGALPADGRRREAYDLGPGMRKFAAATPPPALAIEDLYGWWAYARHAGAWEKVLARKDAVAKLAAAPVPAFDHASKKGFTADRLNATIAGLMGAVAILRKAGDATDAAEALLRRLVEDRIHHERADSNFVRETGHGAHSGTIPRYVDLVPELARLLREHAGPELARNLADLDRQLPVWHQAFAERMAGGENYTHSPGLARGLFAATADGLRSPGLAAKLDQPWCRADLYHVEKRTALLRAGN